MNIDLVLAINIAVAVIYVYSIVKGYKSGFLYEFLYLALTLGSFWLALRLNPILCNLFPLLKPEQFSEVLLIALIPRFNQILWFLIIVILIRLIVLFFLPAFKKLSDVPLLGSVNQLLGAALGVINATILVFLISMFLTLPLIKNGPALREKTVLKPINELTNQGINYMMSKVDVDELEENVKEMDQRFQQWLQEQIDAAE
ncbi:MAG: CvpA family protein [Erysipelotrichaceae bacterium]|nr:CvpA family protein [Erysipelotrichaceae bacterium]MBR2552976.1 CvpA family protein [Erysipelotrichaceae bacterium]